jgi:hypothetical protein
MVGEKVASLALLRVEKLVDYLVYCLVEMKVA